jgi:hypothetical protein
VPFPLEQFFSPHPAGIIPVADLQPRCVLQAGIQFSLCNYAFEIALTDKMIACDPHASKKRARARMIENSQSTPGAAMSGFGTTLR